MTKQQTVELLQKQLPGFYSLAQVIEIISGIDDASNSLSKEKVDELIALIKDAIEDRAGNLDSSDCVEFDSAEFDLNGNEISLSGVNVNSDFIANEVVEAVENAIEEFLMEQS